MQQKTEHSNVKIALIKTGGTIDTSLSYGVLDLNSDKNDDVCNMYLRKNENCNIYFERFSPFRILSENSDFEALQKLSDFFASFDFADYNGVIITHGTDTLSFTSAFLSFILRNVKVPVVMVASNLPIYDERSNAFENFSSAVDFILEQSDRKRHNGVFVTYKDSFTGAVNVHLGSRLISADIFSHNFTSPNNMPFGVMENGEYIAIGSHKNPMQSDFKQDFAGDLRGIKLENTVLSITPYVGIDYNSIVLDKNVKCVIHRTYHAGTVATDGQSSVIPFIEKCVKNGVDFYLAGAKSEGEDIYASVGLALTSGAIPLPSMTWETSIIKALIAYNQKFMTPFEFMTTNISFEIIAE